MPNFDAVLGEIQYADANPSNERLKTFRRLAGLRIESRKIFEHWCTKEGLSPTEELWKAWSMSRKFAYSQELFDIVRTAAIFDESFRLPQLKTGTDEFQQNVEEKFARLMQRISILALTIQKEQEEILSLENNSAKFSNPVI